MPIRLLAVYALGVILGPVPVPVDGLAGNGPAKVSITDRPLAVAVASADGGFVLDRDGQVIRVVGDGSTQLAASIGRHTTPFGTAVAGDRIVFGGVRCDGPGCRTRIAEMTVLDHDGQVESSVSLVRTSDGPSNLDGLALVGTDDETVWVNGGGTLFQVAVAPSRPAEVVAEVPWPGGEPCVIDGALYDLVPSGGTYGQQGAELASTAAFRLRLYVWNGDDWRPVDGGATLMAYGQNAYCSPAGYEIRDGDVTSSRWEPGRGWRAVTDAWTGGSLETDWLAPVTTSTGARYTVGADGSLIEVTGPKAPRWTGVVIPEVTTSDMPPAIQVDDAGGHLFWCATTYRGGAGSTRCAGVSHEQRRIAEDKPLPSPSRTPVFVSRGTGRRTAERSLQATGASEVHHYNLCSAACGSGVRSHSRDLVAWFVDRHGPVALSLNELCYADGVHLSGRMPSGFDAGASYVAMDTVTNCPGAIKQFGNQVRVPSGAGDSGRDAEPGSGWWAQFPTQAGTPCDHRARECRGMVCAEAGPGRHDRVFCSAHLESPRRGPSVAGAQAGEYLDLVEDRYGGHTARVLAGDFNLDRPDADALLVTGGYHSAATGSTVDGHDPSASKEIDMVYFDGPTPPNGPTGSTYCDPQASDHCYVMASPNPLGLA